MPLRFRIACVGLLLVAAVMAAIAGSPIAAMIGLGFTALGLAMGWPLEANIGGAVVGGTLIAFAHPEPIAVTTIVAGVLALGTGPRPAVVVLALGTGAALLSPGEGVPTWASLPVIAASAGATYRLGRARKVLRDRIVVDILAAASPVFIATALWAGGAAGVAAAVIAVAADTWARHRFDRAEVVAEARAETHLVPPRPTAATPTAEAA